MVKASTMAQINNHKIRIQELTQLNKEGELTLDRIREHLDMSASAEQL